MPKPLPTSAAKNENTVFAVFEDEAPAALAALKPAQSGFLAARNFTGKAGSLVILPGEGGALHAWFGLGVRTKYNPLAFRALPSQLPKGTWTLKLDAALDRHAIHVAWGLGAYSFNRYKPSGKVVEAVLNEAGLADAAAVAREVRAHNLVRDLVNTPANDLGPGELAEAAREIAEAHGARLSVISGDGLLSENYPAVHAVGRASSPDHVSRFIELSWDGPGIDAPTVVLIGKGVIFDTGGLNIKPGAGMGHYVDAVKVNPEDREAANMVLRIDALFVVDREAARLGLNAAERQAVREAESREWLEEIKETARSAVMHVLPRSKLGEALNYTLKQWDKLARCVTDGEVELSNNLAENSMRPWALGRKNWLHVGSVKAGPRIAAIASVVESCRRLGLPIVDYLLDILPGLADRPLSQVPQLTPTRWAASRAKS